MAEQYGIAITDPVVKTDFAVGGLGGEIGGGIVYADAHGSFSLKVGRVYMTWPA
jgi:hypothetical protein